MNINNTASANAAAAAAAAAAADAANKRAALAGQWRTPPVPAYPAGYAPIPAAVAPAPIHVAPAPNPSPAQQQQQQQQQPGQSFSGPATTHIPSNSEDYAKALQEAYRKGAEAARLAQQQIPTAASCPNFTTGPHATPPPLQAPLPQAPPQAPPSNTNISADEAAYAHQVHPTPTTNNPHLSIPDPLDSTAMPPPPQMTHILHAPAPPSATMHHHHHHHSPVPSHYAPVPPPSPHHQQHHHQQQLHQQQQQQQQQHQQQHQQQLHQQQQQQQQLHQQQQQHLQLQQQQQQLPPHQYSPSPPQAHPSTTAVKPPQARSMSMPDMSAYAAQAEEEKRQKRLARNRASARLRRLRKKNLVDAYQTEVGILEKTLKQLKAHEWGRDDDHKALLDALGMERGQQSIPADQRTTIIKDILDQQMQHIELLRQAQLEQECLAMLAAAPDGTQSQDDELARELQDLLQLSDSQKQHLQTSSQGLEKEIEALETVAASLQAMQENDWLLNEGVQGITDQFTSILHKNQLSKLLLWTDANVEAIDQLDHVQVQPLQGAPIFTFGVETTPGDDEEGKA